MISLIKYVGQILEIRQELVTYEKLVDIMRVESVYVNGGSGI